MLVLVQVRVRDCGCFAEVVAAVAAGDGDKGS